MDVKERTDWIVVKISQADNILDALFRILVNDPHVGRIGLEAKVDVSIFGIRVNSKRAKPEKNLVQAIDDILDFLDKQNTKVLVTIDEVANTPQICSGG